MCRSVGKYDPIKKRKINRLKLPQRDFPSGPVVRNPPANAWNTFCPWSEKIPHAEAWLSPGVSAPEARTAKACAPKEKSPQWGAHTLQLESSPCWLQLAKAWAQQQRPRVAKNKSVWENPFKNKTHTHTKKTSENSCPATSVLSSLLCTSIHSFVKWESYYCTGLFWEV